MKIENIRLVQLQNTDGRQVAKVAGADLILVDKFSSVYEMALYAIDVGKTLNQIIEDHLSTRRLVYQSIYDGQSEWKLLPAFDHPYNPLACMISGTGLTHKNSALNRQMMHQTDDKPTDSMQMYQWGVEGGSPKQGSIGVQPEWFYKGNGALLRGHGETLLVPPYANDGGEEPEIAGIYVIDVWGNPYRIGFTTGNEFSDHVMEKKNYLYLAPSKLRQCAIGPELVINGNFASFKGKVSIIRNQETLWEANIESGEANMAHNLANLEYHHFKYDSHRIPLQAHVHFFGADAFSYGNQISLQDNDVMEVEWEQMGRPLKNYLKVADQQEQELLIRDI